MTDDAGNGAPTPAISPEQAEQLRGAIISQIANDAKQLLGFVGFAVDDQTLLQAAATQLSAQTTLLQQILPTFAGPQRTQYPIFFMQFSRPASVIKLVGAPMSSPFVVGGPKRLNQDSPPSDIASALAALGFAVNPALRVAVTLLGLQLNFGQAPPPQSTPRIKV